MSTCHVQVASMTEYSASQTLQIVRTFTKTNSTGLLLTFCYSLLRCHHQLPGKHLASPPPKLQSKLLKHKLATAMVNLPSFAGTGAMGARASPPPFNFWKFPNISILWAEKSFKSYISAGVGWAVFSTEWWFYLNQFLSQIVLKL